MSQRQDPEAPAIHDSYGQAITVEGVLAAEADVQAKLDAFHKTEGSETTMLSGLYTSLLRPSMKPTKSIISVIMRKPGMLALAPVLALVTMPRSYYLRAIYDNEYINSASHAATSTEVTYEPHDQRIAMHHVSIVELKFDELVATTSRMKRRILLEELIVRHSPTKTPFDIELVKYDSFATTIGPGYMTFDLKVLAAFGMKIERIAKYYGGTVVGNTVYANEFEPKVEPYDYHVRFTITFEKVPVAMKYLHIIGHAMNASSLITNLTLKLHTSQSISLIYAIETLTRGYLLAIGYKSYPLAVVMSRLQCASGTVLTADVTGTVVGRSFGSFASTEVGSTQTVLSLLFSGAILRPTDTMALMATGGL